MIFSTKKDPYLNRPLLFLNQDIKEVHEHKHLGLTLRHKGTWHTQIDNLENSPKKARALIG